MGQHLRQLSSSRRAPLFERIWRLGHLVSCRLLYAIVLCNLANSGTFAQQAGNLSGKTIGNASTPEAAIVSFFDALAEGDTPTALGLLVSPNEMGEYCRTQVQLSLAFKQLGDAAQKRFGEEGSVLSASPADAIASGVRAKLREVQPVKNGNEAEWRSNPNVPMKLVCHDGRWKLDFLSSFKRQEHLDMSISLFQGIAEYVADIATSVSNGEFESVSAVQAALREQRQLLDAELLSKWQKRQAD